MSSRFLNVKPLLIVVSALIVAACGGEQQRQAPPKPSIQAVVVKQSEVSRSIEYVGRTQASEDVVISPRVSGQLFKRLFEEGHDVEEGQLLFQIDPAPYQAEVNRLEASMVQAESEAKVAKLRYDRGDSLHEEQLLSDMDMDELSSRLVQAEAAIAQAKATLETAKLNLQYTEIHAPISGRISRAHSAIGDVVSTTTKMATLVKLDPIWVNFQASDKSMLEARRQFQEDGLGMSSKDLIIKLRLPNNVEYAHTGQISAADNRIDATTGTLSVTAIFDNKEHDLLPGLYTTIIVESPRPEQALLVEQRAIQQDQQGYFVMLVNAEDKIEKRVVRLGAKYGVDWLVEDGIELGDRVVVVGLQKIRPGIEVEVEEIEPTKFNELN